MNNNTKPAWLLATLLVLAIGHGNATAAGATPEVPAVGIEDINKLITAQKGKVVVLNFWATWCPPCMKEFPDIIKLYDQYQGKGLTVIAVSMNESDEIEEVDAFVGEHKPPFPVYRAAQIDEAFYQGVSKEWLGEMPLTMIFDPATKLAKFHKKELTFAEFERDITPLLPVAAAK